MKTISIKSIVSVARKRFSALFECDNPPSRREAVVLSQGAAWGFAPVLLAQIEDAGFKSFMSGAGRWLILLGVILLISAVAALIVILRFRPGRHRHRHRKHRHHRDHHSESAEPEATPPPTARRHHRHRRRRSVHVEYPKNPTLAETGGLPPVRPDDQPPKF